MKLFKWGKRPDPKCQRCGGGYGDLIHMFWRCPKLHIYWKGVVERINLVFGTSLRVEARECLLGLTGDKVASRDIQTARIRCLFQGKKLIAQYWQRKEAPTVSEWVNAVREVICREKYIYKKRG